MHGAHHGRRLVGADRQRRHAERPQAPADVAEAVEVAGVAREVEPPRRTDHHPTGPQGTLGIREAASAPVLTRYAVRFDRAESHAVPPVELVDRSDSRRAQQRADARAARGSAYRRQRAGAGSPDRDGRSGCARSERNRSGGRSRERQRRRREPARADERERARDRRPDRVGQERHTVHLHEHGGVADPGDGGGRCAGALARSAAPSFAITCAAPGRERVTPSMRRKKNGTMSPIPPRWIGFRLRNPLRVWCGGCPVASCTAPHPRGSR